MLSRFAVRYIWWARCARAQWLRVATASHCAFGLVAQLVGLGSVRLLLPLALTIARGDCRVDLRRKAKARKAKQERARRGEARFHAVRCSRNGTSASAKAAGRIGLGFRLCCGKDCDASDCHQMELQQSGGPGTTENEWASRAAAIGTHGRSLQQTTCNRQHGIGACNRTTVQRATARKRTHTHTRRRTRTAVHTRTRSDDGHAHALRTRTAHTHRILLLALELCDEPRAFVLEVRLHLRPAAMPHGA